MFIFLTQILGFDFMLDTNFKAWLLEVNGSPCVTLPHYGNSSVEYTHNKLVEMLNIARLHLPKSVTEHFARELNKPKLLKYAFNKQLYHNEKSEQEKDRQEMQLMKLTVEREHGIEETLLKTLSPNDVRKLMISEDELAISKRTERLFPSPNMQKYLKYFSEPRYFNYLLEAWEQKQNGDRSKGIAELNRLSKIGYHLM